MIENVALGAVVEIPILVLMVSKESIGTEVVAPLRVEVAIENALIPLVMVVVALARN